MAVVPGGPSSRPAVGAQFFCTAGRGLEPFLMREVRERLAATQVSRPRSEPGREAGRPRPRPCPWSLPAGVGPRPSKVTRTPHCLTANPQRRRPGPRSSAGRSLNYCQKDPPALSPYTSVTVTAEGFFFKKSYWCELLPRFFKEKCLIVPIIRIRPVRILSPAFKCKYNRQVQLFLSVSWHCVYLRTVGRIQW